MYTVISCFCWWRCTPGPTFVFENLVGWREILVAVLLSCWKKSLAVYSWLLHSQHVDRKTSCNEAFMGSIRWYSYVSTDRFIVWIEDAGSSRRCWRTYIVKGFKDLGLAAKLLNRRILQDYTIIEVLIDFCMLAHARSIPISANQHIADVVATLFAGCLLQKRGQYLYCMTQPKRWCMLISFPIQILCVSNKIVPVLGEVWTRVRKLCEDRVLMS